jgi:hypothetical protein
VNSSQVLNLFANPFLLWSQLAWKTGEMAIAAAQVIGHRMSSPAFAGFAPSARDLREFALMGREKGVVGLESALAAGEPLLRLNQQVAALAFKQVMSASVALMSIAASRTPAESISRHSKLVRDTMTGSVIAASKLSGSTAEVARRALTPVRRRISGNARRLGRR